MTAKTCETCHAVHGSAAVVAVGRFDPDVPRSYRATPCGPLRATRTEAHRDVCADRDPLGALVNTRDPDQAEAAMRALKARFSGNDIIAMAHKAGWMVKKNTDLADYLFSPGYASFAETPSALAATEDQ